MKSTENSVIEEEVTSLYEHETERLKKQPESNICDEPGTYIVDVSYLNVGRTKSTNKLALKACFTITDGEKLGQKIYMTTTLSCQFTIRKACEFLKSLGTNVSVAYDNEQQFATTVETIYTIIKNNCEYDLKYWTNEKGFKEFKIEGIYDLV